MGPASPFPCLSRAFVFPKVFLYFSRTTMANLGNELVNATYEFDSDESLSFVGFENPDYMDIFYGVDPPIQSLDVPIGSCGLGLDSWNDNDDFVAR
ncbi:unnamed protein product [Vicia faba]|uniref:Uncharacterized protein n=1 Tax=Vicia faba TaxID=3906 RepID=A0AAV0ZPL6_VICFA|nr:unnamed protein product [Vicia faba]